IRPSSQSGHDFSRLWVIMFEVWFESECLFECSVCSEFWFCVHSLSPFLLLSFLNFLSQFLIPCFLITFNRSFLPNFLHAQLLQQRMSVFAPSAFLACLIEC